MELPTTVKRRKIIQLKIVKSRNIWCIIEPPYFIHHRMLFRMVWPIQPHFRRQIVCSTDSSCVTFHSSSLSLLVCNMIKNKKLVNMVKISYLHIVWEHSSSILFKINLWFQKYILHLTKIYEAADTRWKE